VDTVGEKGAAHGRYHVRCVGPADPADGERIVEYVRDHPVLTHPLVVDSLMFLKERDCWGDPKFDKKQYLEDLAEHTHDNLLLCQISALDYREIEALYESPDSPNEAAARILGIPLVEKWTDEADNLVVNVGKNHMLDNDLQTSVAIVGPFMGLISSTSYTAIAAADTMASHAGWLEAGNANAPTYTAPRKTCAWNAASAGSKALSAALSFAITGTGTVKGAFLVYGTGAVSTIDNTSGTLFSAGLFGTGDRSVLSGDTLNVSYSVGL
jgi:hypothetical protein